MLLYRSSLPSNLLVYAWLNPEKRCVVNTWDPFTTFSNDRFVCNKYSSYPGNSFHKFYHDNQCRFVWPNIYSWKYKEQMSHAGRTTRSLNFFEFPSLIFVVELICSIPCEDLYYTLSEHSSYLLRLKFRNNNGRRLLLSDKGDGMIHSLQAIFHFWIL